MVIMGPVLALKPEPEPAPEDVWKGFFTPRDQPHEANSVAAAQAHQLHHHIGRRAFEEVFGYVGSQRLILISCNHDHFLALARRTQGPSRLDHPDPTQNTPVGMRPPIVLLQRGRRDGFR